MNLETKALDAINKTNRFEELNEKDEWILNEWRKVRMIILHILEIKNERKCLPC